MKKYKHPIIGVILLAMTVILQIMARNIDGFSQWYVITIYPVIVGTIGRLAGIFPFSIAEIGLYLFITIFIAIVIRAVCKKKMKQLLINIFLTISILLFLYSANCGVNYYRISFAESEGVDLESYSVEELKETCIWLTEKVNDWASYVSRDENGVMVLTEDEKEEAVHSMKSLGKKYPELSGYYPKPKALINHWILSVQKVSGIYSPFTIEANYNKEMTDYNIPLTVCHELSHLKGFMQEEEANFIAFLACIESKSADFQYGGYMLGWIHCMNLLYRTDYDAWQEIRQDLSHLVEPDLKANSEFWNRYDSRVAEVADQINDTYLKANGQSDGVESYGRMADLIVIYHSHLFV